LLIAGGGNSSKAESWRRPNRQTSFRQHGGLGVGPRLAFAASAGTTRRSDCSDILGLALAILFPEQLQGHILVALQLAVDFCEVDGSQGRWAATRRRRGKQQFIQPAVVAILRQRPAQTRCRSSFELTMKRSIDRWNNYARSRSAAARDRTVNVIPL
jgi:hypothetical protein